MTSIETPDIVAEYYLARVYRKSFLILEGETDKDTWGQFIAEMHCHTHPLPYGQGKDQIMCALRMELSEAQGVAGLIDADYWLITNSDELETENLLYDECYPDAELILLNSPALTRAVAEFLNTNDKEKVGDFARELRDEAHRLASEFGYFRLLNHVECYGLKFKNIDHSEFLDALEFERDWFARRLTDGKRWISKDKLLQQVDELRKEHLPGNVQLCQGHDTIAIAVYLIPILFELQFDDELFETIKDALKAIDRTELSRRLRREFQGVHFKQTSLYDCIRSWENANSPYKILKPEI